MDNMTQTQWWKNFSLGEELSVAGTFIYNGLRRFHELHQLDYTDDLFEVFYLSIGIERLMKIAIILLEHDDAGDQEAFEDSLMTHNHQALLARLQKHKDIKFSKPENAFLHLLTKFYENLRYDRFSLRSPLPLEKEKHELLDFLEKHLKADRRFAAWPPDRDRFGLRLWHNSKLPERNVKINESFYFTLRLVK